MYTSESDGQFKRKLNHLKKKINQIHSFIKVLTSIKRISKIYQIKILLQIYIIEIKLSQWSSPTQ